MNLSFLGSGFPLFYNYMKYCIILLWIHIVVAEIYNIYTNYYGDYCSEYKIERIHGNRVKINKCSQSIFLVFSFANKLK